MFKVKPVSSPSSNTLYTSLVGVFLGPAPVACAALSFRFMGGGSRGRIAEGPGVVEDGKARQGDGLLHTLPVGFSSLAHEHDHAVPSLSP